MGSQVYTPPQPIGAGATLMDSDIQGALLGEIAAGHLPAPDANSLDVVDTPPNVVVDDGFGTSRADFLGYHGSFFYQGHSYAYAVVVDQYGNASINHGVDVNDAPFTVLQQFTQVTSHQLTEAITDPLPGSGWFDDATGTTGEVGDVVLGFGNYGDILNGGTSYLVQFEWSNALNGPSLAPYKYAYFAHPAVTNHTVVGSPFNGPLAIVSDFDNPNGPYLREHVDVHGGGQLGDGTAPAAGTVSFVPDSGGRPSRLPVCSTPVRHRRDIRRQGHDHPHGRRVSRRRSTA